MTCLASCERDAESLNRVRGKLPFGFVDAPRAGETLPVETHFRGWAVAEEGIRDVAIYIDRTFVTYAVTQVSRPDIAKGFPGFPDSGAAGWNVLVRTAGIPSGVHELVVQARSKSGASRDLGTLSVKIN